MRLNVVAGHLGLGALAVALAMASCGGSGSGGNVDGKAGAETTAGMRAIEGGASSQVGGMSTGATLANAGQRPHEPVIGGMPASGSGNVGGHPTDGGNSHEGGNPAGGDGGRPSHAGMGGELGGGLGGVDAGGAGGAPTGHVPVPTSGCEAPWPEETNDVYLEHSFTVTGLPAEQVTVYGEREYYVRLPPLYDQTRPYPVIFYAAGCGATTAEPTPFVDAVYEEAIIVFLLQADVCFSTQAAPSPDVPYFEQALDRIQAKYCTDESRVFVSGILHGATLMNLLSCASGVRIAGLGINAGILPAAVAGYTCTSPPGGQSAVFFRGELDTSSQAAQVIAGRDRVLAANGCDPLDHEPWVADFSSAVAGFCRVWRAGCEASPVIYCEKPGVSFEGDTTERVFGRGFWELWLQPP